MTTDIRQASIPKTVYLELKNHGWRQQIRVASGDRVLKGSLVVGGEKPLHASTSGIISGIILYPSNRRNAEPGAHLVIHSDGLDEWCENTEPEDPLGLSPQQLEEKIRSAGISGLGGGAFPSAQKLNTARKNTARHFIINAIECERGINTDEAIMLAAPIEILNAALSIVRTLTLEHCTLAIADDKPEVIDSFRTAIEKLKAGKQIKLVTVSADFPNGSERQLINILLGIRLSRNTYPAQQGIVCLNVSTLYAIYQALYENKALVERVITLNENDKAQNMRVHIGTPARDLFKETITADPSAQVFRGGPLTGWLQSPDAVVDKGTTGLQLHALNTPLKAVACIRCAKCADICPEKLLPQELLWYSQPLNVNKLSTLELSACLECGLCESVCPSHIPLTNLFRDSKDSVEKLALMKTHAQRANMRVEKRQHRLANSGQQAQSQRELRLNRLRKKS